MNALVTLRNALVATGADVQLFVPGDLLDSVHAEASLSLIDIVDAATGGLDFEQPHKALAKQIKKSVLRQIAFDNVIFAGTLSTRGAKAGVRPFTVFLQEAGFTTPFMYTAKDTARPAYRTANWQFVMVYENHLGVGSIGRLTISEIATSKRKMPDMTLRQMRKLLAQYAENVPNERGVTGAQKRVSGTNPRATLVHETDSVISDSAVDAVGEPVDTDKARGKRFSSFQDLAAALL